VARTTTRPSSRSGRAWNSTPCRSGLGSALTREPLPAWSLVCSWWQLSHISSYECDLRKSVKAWRIGIPHTPDALQKITPLRESTHVIPLSLHRSGDWLWAGARRVPHQPAAASRGDVASVGGSRPRDWEVCGVPFHATLFDRSRVRAERPHRQGHQLPG